MALMKCPECQAQISSKAESCPHCGNPLRATPDMVGGRQVKTIEKTAKRYKGLTVLFTLVLLLGIILAIALYDSSGMGIGFVIVGLALIGLSITKISAWWHHG